MFKNSSPVPFFTSVRYLDDSNKLAKGIGKFGREILGQAKPRHFLSFLLKKGAE